MQIYSDNSKEPKTEPWRTPKIRIVPRTDGETTNIVYFLRNLILKYFHKFSLSVMCLFVYFSADQTETKFGEDVCDDAQLRFGVRKENPGWAEKTHLRHADQLPGTRRRIQKVCSINLSNLL